ncbi:hypothetical protein [Desertivirga arenae]|uniref:hypothetical protein n=1 Tax=Desertivirga arenae TaxID=2810309 RepID=UPI001A966C22|nr:hypothetical protein [Pedobacter sp. SYSU D00823]
MGKIDKKGIIHGGVDDVSYRSYRGQQIVQMKARKVKQTIATRESGLEFGMCASTARVIREAFHRTYKGGYDGPMINRFNSVVQSAVRACSTKPRCHRNLHDADLSYIRGFQFNNNSPLDKVLKARPDAIMETGVVRVFLPAFSREDIKEKVANYCIIRLLLVAFDFKKKVYRYLDCKEIKIDDNGFDGGNIELEGLIPQGSVALLTMSVHAYVNDVFDGSRSINSKEWSPSEIIGAWHMSASEKQEHLDRKDLNGNGFIVDVDIPFVITDPLKKLKELYKKKYKPDQAKAGSLKVKKKVPEDEFELPKGEISFS